MPAKKRSMRNHQRRLANERAELEASLATMERQLDQLVQQAQENAESDFSEEGGDPDGSVVEMDRLRSRIIVTREHLEAVDRAEAAIEDGTYGTCRVCGAEIPEERLEALPDTRLCVSCKAAGHAA